MSESHFFALYTKGKVGCLEACGLFGGKVQFPNTPALIDNRAARDPLSVYYFLQRLTTRIKLLISNGRWLLFDNPRASATVWPKDRPAHGASYRLTGTAVVDGDDVISALTHLCKALIPSIVLVLRPCRYSLGCSTCNGPVLGLAHVITYLTTELYFHIEVVFDFSNFMALSFG